MVLGNSRIFDTIYASPDIHEDCRYRVSHKRWDFKDNLNLFKYDDPKFTSSLQP